MKRMWPSLLLVAACLTLPANAAAAETTKDKKTPAAKMETKAAKAKEDKSILPAPPRAEGDGPFKRLILRGAILVDGTGAPPVGPVDIVIEKNRIADVQVVGSPGVEIDAKKRPKAETGDKEIDLHGMYVVPGLIDMH